MNVHPFNRYGASNEAFLEPEKLCEQIVICINHACSKLTYHALLVEFSARQFCVYLLFCYMLLLCHELLYFLVHHIFIHVLDHIGNIFPTKLKH